jgi:hypothetical protein
MPESYDEAWRRLDEDAARRWRQATAEQIEAELREHRWDGGLWCRCGEPVDMPVNWGRHLLELVLFDQAGLS